MNLEQFYERWEQKTLARGRREGEANGRREAMAKAVLAVVEGRGLAITAAQRDRVLACDDIAQLDAWIHTAGTTPSMKALLTRGRRKRAAEERRRFELEALITFVFLALDDRELAFTAAQYKHIVSCTDEARLRAWRDAAVTAPSVKALLSGTAPVRGGAPAPATTTTTTKPATRARETRS